MILVLARAPAPVVSATFELAAENEALSASFARTGVSAAPSSYVDPLAVLRNLRSLPPEEQPPSFFSAYYAFSPSSFAVAREAYTKYCAPWASSWLLSPTSR